MGKDKWRDQQVFTPDGASTTVERREIESEALLCNDRTLKGRPLLWRELRRVLEEEGEWEKIGGGGGGGGSEMEQKLPTAVVQLAQQMLYFGKQGAERQRGKRKMTGAQISTLHPCLFFKVQQMETERRGGET